MRTLSTGTVPSAGPGAGNLHQPAVLLLDEPTRSLDPIAAAEFRRLAPQKSSAAREPRWCLLRTRWRKSSSWRSPGAARRRKAWPSKHRVPARLGGAASLDEAISEAPRSPVRNLRKVARAVRVRMIRDEPSVLRKILAFFRRDLSIARSYRIAFVFETSNRSSAWPLFYYLSRFVESDAAQPRVAAGGLTSPSRWWALHFSIISA